MQSTHSGESQSVPEDPSAVATTRYPSGDWGSALERSGKTDRTSGVNVGLGERVASAVLGAGLVTLLRRPSVPRVAMALAGGALLHRGLTGRCRVYQALGMDTARGGALGSSRTKSALITSSMTIRATAEELQRRFLDPSDLTRIMGHLAEVRANPDGGLHWSVPGNFGIQLEWDSRLVEMRPGELIRLSSNTDPTNANELRVYFSPSQRDFGTVVKLQWRFEAPLATALTRLFEGSLRRVGETALRRFKSLVETGEIATNRMNGEGYGGANRLAHHR
ncbi:MAG TPA: YgaP-like transmembrane domain [Polyangiaceae bacterium]